MHIKKIIGTAKLTLSAVILLQQIGFAQENNAKNSPALAVQLLNQNSIYLGIDNPVRIVCEKAFTEVSVSNGEIIPTTAPFDFIVRTSSTEPCTLLVKNNEMLLATTLLRVKRLPAPQLFLGAICGPATISKTQLTASNILTAKIQNLDEGIASFQVIAYEIEAIINDKAFSFRGNGKLLSKEVMEKFRTADVDDKIWIDSKVKGPDGVITTLPPLSIKIE
jgi:hypothetical protein